MIGLTCLTTNGMPLMAPKLNRRRAVFVLSKIDEILAWERATDQERDSRFVDLGRYLCETRAGQYWRLDNMKSFDEFLERRWSQWVVATLARSLLAGVSKPNVFRGR